MNHYNWLFEFWLYKLKVKIFQKFGCKAWPDFCFFIILGYAYASAPYERAAYRWCAEPSVYLREEARGREIAAQLYRVLEAILEQQGYFVLYALITAENTVSVRFHEKMGYRIQAEFPDCGFKHGRWCGLFWMEKRLKIVESPSAFPKSCLSIVQDAETFSNILDSLSLS